MTSEEFIATLLMMGGEVTISYVIQWPEKVIFHHYKIAVYISSDGNITVFNGASYTWSWDLPIPIALEFIKERVL